MPVTQNHPPVADLGRGGVGPINVGGSTRRVVGGPRRQVFGNVAGQETSRTTWSAIAPGALGVGTRGAVRSELPAPQSCTGDDREPRLSTG
jgi:hypothetical protein